MPRILASTSLNADALSAEHTEVENLFLQSSDASAALGNLLMQVKSTPLGPPPYPTGVLLTFLIAWSNWIRILANKFYVGTNFMLATPSSTWLTHQVKQGKGQGLFAASI